MSGSHFVRRGQAFVDRGHYQEAVKVCRLGLLASPTEVEGRVVLATALMALRRYDEVLAEMRVALELAPGDPRASELKGEALLRKGDALQAREVLERAYDLVGAGSRVAELLGEIQEVLGAGGRRRSTAALSAELLADPDQLTKHYPAAPPVAGFDEDTANREPGDLGAAGVPRGALDIGESAKTIELDPSLAAIELEPGDDPADPDAARVGASPMVPSGGDGGGILLATAEVELLSGSDLLPLGPDESGAFTADEAEEPTRKRETRADSPAGFEASNAGPLTSPTVSERLPLSPHVDQQRRIAASAAAVDAMFPDDATMRSRVELFESFDERPGATSGAIDVVPDGRTPPRPTLAAVTGLEPARVVSRGPRPPTGVPRSRTGDMDIIKQGLGLEEARTQHRQSPRSRARLLPRPGPARRGRALLGYAIIAVLVIGGAVFAGLEVREARLEREVQRAVRDAEVLAHEGTYRGYLRAAEAYRRILAVRDTPELRAARARMVAATSAEYGTQTEPAQALLEGLGDEVDATAARAYVALAVSDGDAASRHAAAVVAAGDPQGRGSYLAGLAAMLRGEPQVAVAAFGRALAGQPTPAAFVGLARAHAARGRYAEALAALDSALSAVSGFPPAVLERARVQVQSGQLPVESALEGELEALMADGERPLAEQSAGVSPAQLGWAALVLARARLARGDRPGARAALARAVTTRPTGDLGFAEALVDCYLALGEPESARREAEAAAAAWPQRPEPKIRLAEVELDTGNPDRALDALAELDGLSGRPMALCVRGRARLALGEIDAAAADLDAALVARPDLRTAQVARAAVDLQRGDARGAVSRLKPLYDSSSTADIGILYAAALRQSGERERARSVLSVVLSGMPAADAYLELARLDRDEGRFRDARASYANAIERDPDGVAPRLEAALLALDVGDLEGSREALDKLVEDAPSSGRVLVAAAQLRVLTGDHDGALALLDRAEAEPTASRWHIMRERGRLALAQRSPTQAVESLTVAAALQPDDGDTRRLLVLGYLLSDDLAGASQVLSDVLKRFGNRPDAAIALGEVHFYNDRPKDALTSFADARDALAKGNAPPREQALAHYWIGRTHFYDDRLKDAKAAFERALALVPRYAEAWYFLGQVEYERGQRDTAIDAYRKAVEADPRGQPDAWYYLGDALASARKKKPAREALTTYVEQFPEGLYVEQAQQLLRKL